MTWKLEAAKLLHADCQPPDGHHSLEQIARDIGCSEDKAREIVNRLVKAGRATAVNGKRLTAAGQMQPCKYYALAAKKK